MSECTHLSELLESQGWREGLLSQAQMDHAQACQACEQSLRSYRAYASLVAGARAALEHEGGMSPESWARLRSTAEKQERRAILEWMLQPALALAMAAMVFWIASGSPSTTTVLDERFTEHRPTPPVHTVLKGPAPSKVAIRTLGPGSVVAARSQTRELVAFDRHVMELSPRTRVTIVAWNPRRIVLNITSGSVHAVVRREREGDHFELRTAHVRARALGTDYRVSVRQQGVTTVRVAHGAVEVTDTSSNVTRVEAGEAVQVDVRGPLTQAMSPKSVKAPAAPAGTSRPGGQKARSVRTGAPSTKKAAPSDAAESGPKPSTNGLKVIEIDIAPQSADPPGG